MTIVTLHGAAAVQSWPSRAAAAEERHLFRAAGPGWGVIDDEQLPVSAADAERVAVQREVADTWVVDAGWHPF